jgi:hypothetical protein
MADASKLKRLGRLGAPPDPDEARNDLVPPATPDAMPTPVLERRADASPVAAFQRIDARTLRRSGRTVHFATKVTPEFDNRLRQIAAETGKMLTEILEEALAAYEREKTADR